LVRDDTINSLNADLPATTSETELKDVNVLTRAVGK